MSTLEQLKEYMRILVSYRYDSKKGEVIKTIHICDISTVNETYRKIAQSRQTVIALAKGSTWCENCYLTACWDKGKAIMCNQKKETETE